MISPLSLLKASRNSDASRLYLQLLNIYGADLIGLWIGEDILTDGLGNVTSWPGRVGGTLTPANASYLNNHRIENNRLSVYRPTATAGDSGLIIPISASTSPKSVWTVCNGPPLGGGAAYRTLAEFIGGTGEYPLVKDTGVDTWYSGGWTHYQNSVATETRIAGQAVYEGVKASPATDNTTFRITCEPSAPSGAWIWGTWFIMNLAEVPTTLQRLETQLALDTYYRPTQAPAAQLALDLYNVLGADLVGLWVGEDVVVDGSSNVTSWPGRFGGILTPIAAGTRTANTVSGRRSTITSDVAVSRAYQVVGSTMVAKAWMGVAVIPTLPFGNYRVIVGAGGTGGALYGTISTNNIGYGADAAYVDGVATNSVAGLTGTIHILEADYSTSTDAGARLAGTATLGEHNWPESLSLAMSISAVPSAGNRAAVVALLQAYYGI